MLIVDDEPALTELSCAAVAVAEAGRRPCPALDGESALRLARSWAPHAVVHDGVLPDLDGLQVLRRQLRHESPRLPVLVLTARKQLPGEVWTSCFDSGENLAEPEVYISSPRRKIDKLRAPMIRTVRAPGYAIRAGEDGR
ncbi:DNA-binding response regulator family protein [Streptomyces turgidiscabies Car8]|uniref:DNA-binding response regulator family protein n=1 Tax=Streptomyces turgidiscabies (strain Car8) TaxID=698760 RepID=L7ETH8_STRT8|nr:DNA-binding response regulator family protein [Streptomyces turgidiscabies Car8]